MHHSHEDFWVSRCFQPLYLALIMYEGFLPIATQQARTVYLLPKLHMERCILDPAAFHISKSVRKKAKDYTLKFNTAFDAVVRGCHEQHGVAWLYPEVVQGFRGLLPGITVSDQGHQVRLHSAELWRGDVLVAGELGYTNGAMYTSLTGFVRPGANGAGTMQLQALGSYLHVHGFQLWDLGMSMEYKLHMGAMDVPRPTFVQMVRELRNRTKSSHRPPPKRLSTWCRRSRLGGGLNAYL
ncbi:hypothetical protein SPRG_19010 [Saprolegnia parasitica CBS 223.65]|uniref:Leucyl/phenylalanyl-tRNA-protein transferase n=1 Tax=Saprolegnia parasitica (strain CBS 223.65) TaxID=695850 RepID=A0A067CY29_SAPPC|nr:hypothetical protein SPRG_19010 [Saprolegnia parasitica CBS 223.65]KDO34155.1 hypothetical protein SPRG_19010 [Saprolegnia parasitica CBS 223.65]|eukprot:XP_012195209.1 hypothetical protein SPRG_19010 [Saprolegnia parasitica CBS 223.65]